MRRHLFGRITAGKEKHEESFQCGGLEDERGTNSERNFNNIFSLS